MQKRKGLPLYNRRQEGPSPLKSPGQHILLTLEMPVEHWLRMEQQYKVFPSEHKPT